MTELKPCRPRNFANRNMRAWCGGCGVDTGWDGLGEWYTVTDSVWEQAWPGTSLAKATRHDAKERYFLCVGCLEQKLGRKLTSSDFVAGNCLNNPSDKWSERLIDRLTPCWLQNHATVGHERRREALNGLLKSAISSMRGRFRRRSCFLLKFDPIPHAVAFGDQLATIDEFQRDLGKVGMSP
jgi:hypothetical protein